MRILLDECVHAGVRVAFSGHATKTVTEAGWRGTKDGPLLALAERDFDVFVTIDRALEVEQPLSRFRLGFVVVRVPDNTLAAYRPLFGQLRDAVQRVKPGEVIHLSGVLKSRR